MEKNFSELFTPKLVVGRGAIDFFATLGKKRIGIIRGGKSFSSDIQNKIEELAFKTNAEVCYLAQVRNEPYVEDIYRNLQLVNEFQPDMILAIGGGSVLDTAKAIHLFYENPELTLQEAMTHFRLPRLGKKAIHISVPTTSGTGSEATSVAVFIDRETKTKKLIMDNTIIPHYAIIDANATESLPKQLRISTGMDALTHAIEASIATNGTYFTKAIAIEASLDLLENLEKSICNFSLRNTTRICNHCKTFRI